MKESLLAYLGRMHRHLDYPYREVEDFYAKSKHSEHMRKAMELEVLLDKTPRHISVMFSRIFILGYALSAVYAEMRLTDSIVTTFWGSGHPKWFHGPFLGGLNTISCQFNGSRWKVSVGGVITRDEISADTVLKEAFDAYAKFHEEVYKGAWEKTPEGRFEKDGEGNPIYVPNGVARFNQEIPQLHAALKQLFESLVNEAVEMVEKL